jgi:hypothetical protein
VVQRVALAEQKLDDRGGELQRTLPPYTGTVHATCTCHNVCIVSTCIFAGHLCKFSFSGARPRSPPRFAFRGRRAPRCFTVRRRRPLPAPRPVHPPPRGVPPAADKNALRTQLKVNMLRIRERELLFFTNNCLSISTSAVPPSPPPPARPHTAARLRDLRLTSTRARPPSGAIGGLRVVWADRGPL